MWKQKYMFTKMKMNKFDKLLKGHYKKAQGVVGTL